MFFELDSGCTCPNPMVCHITRTSMQPLMLSQPVINLCNISHFRWTAHQEEPDTSWENGEDTIKPKHRLIASCIGSC